MGCMVKVVKPFYAIKFIVGWCVLGGCNGCKEIKMGALVR